MFGFIGALGLNVGTEDLLLDTYGESNGNLIINDYSENVISIRQCTLKKFEKDKIFYFEDNFMVVVEGIIYNFKELSYIFSEENYGRLLKKLFNEYGERFIEQLNGNFCMTVYTNGKLLLYANHTGFKPLFYFFDGTITMFSSDINWLYNNMEANNISLMLNQNSAICLCTHGYMLGDNTLVNNVKKVMPGHYIRIEKDNSITDVTWHKFNYKPSKDLNKDDLLEHIEGLFLQAVDRIYKKDEEYKYKHFCTLSGGLDSRSVAFVANELGYEQFFATMGESGCMDEVVATKIARDLKSEHVMLHLDNGNYLKCVKTAVKGNGGCIAYPGFAHLYSLFNSVNLNEYGQIITGEIGDVIFGGGKEQYKGKNTAFFDGAFAPLNSLATKINDEFREYELNRYSDAYMYIFYNRVLNSALNGWLASYRYTESASPFLDKDFMEYMIKIKSSELKNSNIYVSWMEKYHPQMCKYRWTTTRTKPNDSRIKKLIVKICIVIGSRIRPNGYSMNPYELWMSENESLRKEMDKIIFKNSKFMQTNSFMRELYNAVLESKKVFNKLMLVTLLETIEEYQITCD